MAILIEKLFFCLVAPIFKNSYSHGNSYSYKDIFIIGRTLTIFGSLVRGKLSKLKIWGKHFQLDSSLRGSYVDFIFYSLYECFLTNNPEF
jgi:hypothetical protein